MKMLKNKNKILLILLPAFCFGIKAMAQDSAARQMILSISYYMPNDKIPYLKVSATEKVERKFIPLKDIAASVYLGGESEKELLGKIKTDGKGESKVYIPAAFKPEWDSSGSLTFLVVTGANKIFESTTGEIQVTKAKIEIDTTTEDEIRKIIVKVTELKNGEWMPAPEAELKITVKRLLGNLPISEEETYTTDSGGMINAEFIRDSLPGDKNGFFTLIARTEDSELYGNIFAEKTIAWGVPPIIENNFYKRSLWAPRFRTPYWLLALAYSIIGGVWGTLIYLIWQLLKIKKIGREYDRKLST